MKNHRNPAAIRECFAAMAAPRITVVGYRSEETGRAEVVGIIGLRASDERGGEG